MSKGPVKQSIVRQIEPRKFSQQGVKLSGFVPVESMSRLAQIGDSKSISADLQFYMGEQKERCVTGVVRAEFVMECQRCLGDVELAIDCELFWQIVRDTEKAKQIPESCDPWIVCDEEADLYAMLEEELLLNIPNVVTHTHDCMGESLSFPGPEDKHVAEDENVNPFQVLSQLKDKK